jgi:YegS/Rv2252/BmrU family lipid kinase
VRPLCVIVNPHAGGGRAGRLLPRVTAALDALSAPHRIERTRSLEHARALAREASAAGELPVAMGGDGLTGAVVDALRGDREATIGVIPGGRGNDFARKLGIPSEIDAACRTAVDGAPRPVDVANVDGRSYLGIASAGIDSDVQVIANESRLPLGNNVYAYAYLRALALWKPARFHVRADDRELDFVGFSVAVANSGVFGGGMYLSPDSELDDGILEVVIFESTSKLRCLRNLPRVFKGTHVEDPAVVIFPARSVAIDCDRTFDVYADGDPIAPLPATVGVERHAISVMVPGASGQLR